MYAIVLLVLFYYLLKGKEEGFTEKVNCTYYSEEKEKMVYGLTDPKNCAGVSSKDILQ
jgi:hypothetical protein